MTHTLRCITKNNTMTHVKNAEAFARLVDFCTGYGGKYNPGRQNLRIENITAQLEEVRQAMGQVTTAKTNFDNEVNHRKQVFDQLPRLASSILRTLEASGAAAEKLDDARTFVHQITGMAPKSRAPIPSGEAQPAIVKRGRLQLAYVSKADSFSKLVKAVETEPLYIANESTLNIAGLSDKISELNEVNQQVATARMLWSNSLIGRNEVMYRQSMSLYQAARAVRKYVRAIFGYDSEQYAQIKNLTFVKPQQ